MTTKKRVPKPQEKPSPEVEELRAQLAEAQDTLRAIREGEVDAVIISGSKGEQVFSLVGTESIYRLIVETMKEAAFTVTFDGTILFCNSQFGEFLKLPMERILGRLLQEFVDPANLPAANTLLSLSQEKPVKQRLVLLDSQGERVPVHISANVLNQPDGLSICLVATDIRELENSTEMIQELRRRQEELRAANEELAATEEELRVQNEELAASRLELDRARARYQGLFETAPDGYLVTDAEGTIQEANHEAVRIFGLGAEDLKGNPFSALLPLTERSGYLEVLTSLHAGQTLPPKWEVELQPQGGPRFWAAISAAASRDEGGNIVGMRWLIRDVTDRMQVKQELQRNEKKFRSLFENSLEAIFLTHPDGRVTDVNPAACRMFGKSKEEICRLGRAALFADDAKEMQSAIEERARTGKVNREMTFLLSNGTRIHTEVSSVIIKEEPDARAFVIVRDVTARKRAEDALQDANARLEQKVQERTQELAQQTAHLRALAGELTLSEQRERRRIASVLHDHLQQVLVGAKFRASMLGRHAEPLVRQSALDVEDLLNEAIQASRSLTAELNPPILHEGGLKAGLIWLAKWMTDKHGLVVNVSIEEDLPTLPEDVKVLLFESVRELLFNAVKHARVGSADVAISKTDGWNICIAVSDAGAGFDPIKVKKAGHAGAGFGLFGIGERLGLIGGKMEVYSAPGKGSRFILTAPYGEEAIKQPGTSSITRSEA